MKASTYPFAVSWWNIMEPEWAEIVAEVIGEMTSTVSEASLLLDRLRATRDYGDIHSLWCSSAPRKEIKRQIRFTLGELGVQRTGAN